MSTNEEDNPYRGPGTEIPAAADAKKGVQPTFVEQLVLIVVALVVAVPTFFTTCIGGALALDAAGVDMIHGNNEQVILILWFVSFLIAIWLGFIVARGVHRIKQRRLSTKDTRGDRQ